MREHDFDKDGEDRARRGRRCESNSESERAAYLMRKMRKKAATKRMSKTSNKFFHTSGHISHSKKELREKLALHSAHRMPW